MRIVSLFGILLTVTLVWAGATSAPARAQTPSPARAGEILVRFQPGARVQSVADAHRQNGGQVKRTIPQLDVSVVEVPAGQERARVDAYRRDPNVLFAEVNGVYRIAHVPNDPSVATQWQFNNTGQSQGINDADIDAYEAWDITEGNPSVIIAILDTGIDQNHEDLASKIVKNANFSSDPSWEDGHGHGTHVAGSAAAVTNNGVGVAGACPKCSLMNVKVMDNDGSGTFQGIADGIIWATDNGAKVINLSIGDTVPSATVEAAVEYAWENGVVVVAAAGNKGNSVPFYPAYYGTSIAVAATDRKDARASFSNAGSWVDIAAPGADILSTAPDHANANWLFGVRYGSLSGTSMASPHVAGVAGLVWSSGTCSTNACVRDRIEQSADRIPGTGTHWMSGRLNACVAVGGTCTYSPQAPPPTVSIVKPAAAATLTGMTTIQVSASDPAYAAGSLRVEWNVDGGAWQPAAYNTASRYYEAAWDTSTLGDGAHTLNVRATNAGNGVATVSRSVNDRVQSAGPLAFGGSATVSLTAPNTVALLRFTGAAGQRFALQHTNVSISSSTVTLYKPDGTSLTSKFVGTTGAVIDATVLPVAGTYTIVVDPQASHTGSMTLTLLNVPADVTAPISGEGGPATATITAPYQNARLTFNGTAGRRISLRMSNVGIGTSTCCGTKVSVLKPDGGALVSPASVGTNGVYIDAKELTASGAYTILIDPQDVNVGSMTVTLYDVPADAGGALVAGGSPATVTIATPGQNARLTFNGTAGQGMNLRVSNVTVGASTCCGSKVTVLKPDGTAHVAATNVGTTGADIDIAPLPVTGTYTVVFDPQQDATGAATFTLSADVSVPIQIDGAAVPVTLPTPSQNARVSFTGTAGQRLSLGITSVTLGTSASSGGTVAVNNPDGTKFVNATSFGTAGLDLDLKPLPQSGTYVIFIEGAGTATGGLTLTLSADTSDALSFGAQPTVVSLPRPAQNARFTFSGAAGQKATFTFSNVTVGSSTCCGVDVAIYKPDGATLTTTLIGTTSKTWTVTLPVAGTYELLLDPKNTVTGSITVALSSSP